MTKYQWTVYLDGELVDIATDAEITELMRYFSEVILHPNCVAEIR